MGSNANLLVLAGAVAIGTGVLHARWYPRAATLAILAGTAIALVRLSNV